MASGIKSVVGAPPHHRSIFDIHQKSRACEAFVLAARLAVASCEVWRGVVATSPRKITLGTAGNRLGVGKAEGDDVRAKPALI